MYCSKCGKKLKGDICTKCNKESIDNSDYFYEVVNSTSFYVVNLIYFVIGLLFVLIIFDKIFNNDIVILFSILISVIATIFNLTTELMLVKARFPWWGAFVPIYNQIISSKMVFKNGWCFLIPYIPVVFAYINVLLVLMNIADLSNVIDILSYGVSIIYSLISSYLIGKRFGMNSWLVILFPYITLPIIAFSRKYQYID